MDYSEEYLFLMKASFEEGIDKCMSKEELDRRWEKYRKVFQKMLKTEYNKIDKLFLESDERVIMKRFKNCFFSSNVEFRHMQRMLKTDEEVRKMLAKYPKLEKYIKIFEDGYSIC